MDKQKNYKLILHLLITAICLVVFLYMTIRTKPFPISDFQYYWESATKLSIYYKGGLLFLLYAPLKSLGLEPYIAAFIVNSFCFIALSYSMWISRKSKWQLFSSFLLILTGIWLLGFIPIVNTDIPAIVLPLLGIRLFIQFLDTKKNLLFILSIIPMAVGLSLRSQLLYISITLIAVLAGILIYKQLHKQPQNKSLRFFMLFLATSTLIAFATTKCLEMQTQDATGLAMYKRVTFYTGLLNTPSSGSWCGEWTPAGMQEAQDELSIPFKAALISGFKKLSFQQVVEIIQCKWTRYIFEYSQSGLTWLEGHMTKGWTETKNYGKYWIELKAIEYFSAQALKLIAFSLVVIFTYNIKNFKKSEIVVFGFTIFAILMFFGIHTILEIQPRYIIPPVMIALIISLYLHSGMFKKIT